MPMGHDDDRRRDAVRWLDELVAGALEFAPWFEENVQDRSADDLGVDGTEAGDADAGDTDVGSRPVWRGGDERRSVAWADVRVAAFAQPDLGEGSVSSMRLRLLEGQDTPGRTIVPLALQRPGGDDPVDLGWQGPVSGRLLVGAASVDFHARDGSHLARRDGGSVLELVLGTEWIERDETPGELLATLRAVLLLRET